MVFDKIIFRLPFCYFFRFGEKRFLIPYSERQLQYPFVNYDGYMYISGKDFGIPKVHIYTINDPDY